MGVNVALRPGGQKGELCVLKDGEFHSFQSLLLSVFSPINPMISYIPNLL